MRLSDGTISEDEENPTLETFRTTANGQIGNLALDLIVALFAVMSFNVPYL